MKKINGFLILTMLVIMVSFKYGSADEQILGHLLMFPDKNQGCYTDADCGPSQLCYYDAFPPTIGYCGWCPSAGGSCGLTWKCCRGYYCDGILSGICRSY